MDEDNITPNTLPDEPYSSDGEGAVEQNEGNEESNVDNLNLSELNTLLGKDFQTKEAALKSIKDTFNYVGKKPKDVEKDLKDKGYMTREEAENLFFLRDHPEHSNNKDILEALAIKNNVTISEAAKLPAYTKLFEASAKYQEHQSNQSVMDSNPRIAEMKERIDSVREMQRSGDVEGARAEAARMVLESISPDGK